MTNERLPLPVLMLVTDLTVAGGANALVEKVAEAVAGGVNVVQLRDKELPHEELIPLTRSLREAIDGRAMLVVNRPPTTALDARADGVHLPEDAELPREWPHNLLIGRSVHSLGSALRAGADGADYVVFGPVYETPSHAGAPPTGSIALREVVGAVAIPVIAIGGVTVDSVREVVAVGAAGIAVIRAILAADDPRAAAESLREALGAVGSPK
jgi:thiamine-phosphate pyrophosphorylase